jgi:hypothetical protein
MDGDRVYAAAVDVVIHPLPRETAVDGFQNPLVIESEVDGILIRRVQRRGQENPFRGFSSLHRTALLLPLAQAAICLYSAPEFGFSATSSQ